MTEAEWLGSTQSGPMLVHLSGRASERMHYRSSQRYAHRHFDMRTRLPCASEMHSSGTGSDPPDLRGRRR
jgi:hypothetical protein